ncbi:hypothetical protein FPHOBKDP_00110 [Listeria phage LPJP1]|nr:hypothetical protein FPHOBKDP_00110 [Listeria phage LPJP1]
MVSTDNSSLFVEHKFKVNKNIIIDDGGNGKDDDGNEVIVPKSITSDIVTEMIVDKNYRVNVTVLPDNAIDKGFEVITSDNNAFNIVQNSGSYFTIKSLVSGMYNITLQSTLNPNISVSYDIVSGTEDELHPILPETINIINATDEMTVDEGTSMNLDIQVLPENSTNKNVTGYSSNEELATIPNNKTISFIKEGSVDITITSNKVPTLSKTIHFIIKKPDPKRIEINAPNAVTLNIGESKEYLISVIPENSIDKEYISETLDSSIVTTNGKNIIKAVKEGNTTIVFRSKTFPDIFTRLNVIVLPPEPNEIIVSPSNETINMIKLDELVFDVTINPSNAIDLTYKIESSDTNIVKIKNQDTVVAVNPGEANVTISSRQNANLKVIKKIIVTAPDPESIDVIGFGPDETMITNSTTKSVNFIVNPANAKVSNFTVVSSSDSVQINIPDQTKYGFTVKPVKEGNAIITIQLSSFPDIIYNINVRVNNPDPESITAGITNPPNMPSGNIPGKGIAIGEKVVLNAKILPEYANDITYSISSSDNDVFEVRDDGIYALKAGTSKVRVFSNKVPTIFKEFDLECLGNNVSDIELDIQSPFNMVVGNTKQISINILPTDAIDKRYQLKTDDANIVSVLDNNTIRAISLWGKW